MNPLYSTDLNYNLESVLYHCSAALSVFGSSWIIVEIIFWKKRAMCHHRLLFGLSCFDLFSSIWLFAGRWAQTSSMDWGTLQSYGNGNITSCNISGFFIFLGSLGIPWYNASMSIYFYLAICRGWREGRIRRSFERYVHVVICPVAVVIAIIPLFMDMYNNSYFFCFASFSSARNRGSMAAHLTFQTLYIISVIFCSGVTIYMMITIKRYINTTEKKSDAYDFEARLRNTTTRIMPRQEKSRRARRKKERASEVSTLAFLYSVPLLFTWFIPVFWMLCMQITWSSSFKIIPKSQLLLFISNLYLATFLPLQGFINWLIYMRPRMKKIKKRISGNIMASGNSSSLFRRKRGGAEPEDTAANGAAEEAEEAEEEDRDSGTPHQDGRFDDGASTLHQAELHDEILQDNSEPYKSLELIDLM